MSANILSLMNYSSGILVSFSDHNFHSEKKNLMQTVVWVESRLAKCMYCDHTRNIGGNLLWQLYVIQKIVNLSEFDNFK